MCTARRSTAPACCAASALDELFTAAESLGRLGTFPGRRLAILSNGGGVGRLAVDQLIALRGCAGQPVRQHGQLDAVLPQGWSRSNPVDIVVDADGDRYAAAIEKRCWPTTRMMR
jgi:acetyltransferase